MSLTRDLTGPGLARANATGETAREAAKGDKKTLRVRVLELLEHGPAHPEAIFDALSADGVKTVLTSVRPRCSELSRLGLIRDSGRRATGEGGKKAIVWEMTPPDARQTAGVTQ